MSEVESLAATVALVRDGSDGVEVLLLERPHDRGSFAGAWVFPGGAVEPGDWTDADDQAFATRAAAVRETHEETGLDVRQDSLYAFARWHPPAEAPKRLLTWFYLAAAPDGPVSIDPRESIAYAWMNPLDALEKHAAGGMQLYPPTWVTLNWLAPATTAADLIGRVRDGAIEDFRTRFGDGRRMVLWQQDGAYGDDALLESAAASERHRLDMSTLPWVYQRRFRADRDG